MAEEFEKFDLKIDLPSLPFSPLGPLPPFTSVVLNFTVCTLAHRDHHDKGLCVVFVLGTFSGCALVLYEPGLVIPMNSGDFCVFNSWYAIYTFYILHLTKI